MEGVDFARKLDEAFAMYQYVWEHHKLWASTTNLLVTIRPKRLI